LVFIVGDPTSLLIENGKGGRFSQSVIRELGFNPYPIHPLDGPSQRGTWKTCSVRSDVGSSSLDAQAASPDPVREGLGEAPQKRPLP